MTLLGLAGCSEEEGGGENNTSGGETEASTETDASTEPPGDGTTMAETEGENGTETMMETEIRTATNPVTPATQGGFSETFSGSGKSTIEGVELAPGPVTATFSLGSEAFHTVLLVPLEGQSYQNVQLVTGRFSGEGRQAATVAAAGEHNLEVDSEGEWELAIEQPTDLQPESLPVNESGSGYDYAGPFTFDGETTFQGTHDGESAFVVRVTPVDPPGIETTVFNETQQFDGETTKQVDGPAYLNVEADGEWSVSTG